MPASRRKYGTNEWWGYLHTNGTIHVKRYFTSLDITEAKDSPFVVSVTTKFDATNRDEALAIAKGILE